MANSDIEDDLQKMLTRIAHVTGAASKPRDYVLSEALLLLDAFVTRHRLVFSFENFPLPIGTDEALSSYELNENGENGPALLVNAIRGGVESVVHDHGTWTVIVGIEGAEHHRIYRRIDDGSCAHTATLRLVREITVCSGRPLILEEGFFHSIHTDAGQPALQLHLYGGSIDRISGRQIVDLDTGRIAYLSERGEW